MINIKVLSDIGIIREQNEDSYVIEQNELGHHLLLVADGMGGHNAGEVASDLVCQIIAKEFNKITEKIDYKKFIEDVIVRANQKVYKESLLNQFYSKMGTTASLVIYDDEKIYTGHVGDSRIYFIDEKQILQITKDHTLVQAMVEAGSLKEEEVEFSKLKNVLIQALGTSKNITIEIKEIKLPKFFSILICSDGLTGPLKNDMIMKIMNLKIPLEERLVKLVNTANDIDGSDNVTVMVMENRSI